LMASPLSKNLIAGAIGESGAMIGPMTSPVPLAEVEKKGVAFAAGLRSPTVAALRALSAETLLEAAAKLGMPPFFFAVDGYFLPKPPVEIFATGKQAHVPLLAGWNAAEIPARGLLGPREPTPESYTMAVKELYGRRTSQVMKLYPGLTSDEVVQSGTALASDRLIAYGTWKWMDLHAKTGGALVFRYLYSRPRPGALAASHAVEIEYAMGNLATNKAVAWTADDYKVSEIFQGYFANFVKSGDPNGQDLAHWPAAIPRGTVQVMDIDVNTRVESEHNRERYALLDRIYRKE
jgi:para-nitrobenzyl esterase